MGVLVTAGAGGGAPGSSDANKLFAWLDARLVSTLCTCASAAGLVVTADDATADSAEVMLCAAPPVTLMGADATDDKMLSAAFCDSVERVTFGAAVTTASTRDAVFSAATADRLPAAEVFRLLKMAPCCAIVSLALKLANCATTASATADTFAMAVKFTVAGAGAATTGADTATPVQAVRPELCSADTNAAGLTAVMLLASPLAALDDAVVTLNATDTPLACRRRLPAPASVTPVMAMAD